MATSADSFSPGQVCFKPLNNLQRNVSESVLAVCIPPLGYMILTGGEIHLYDFSKQSEKVRTIGRHRRHNQSVGCSIWQAENKYTSWICDFKDVMDTPERCPVGVGCWVRERVRLLLLVLPFIEVPFLVF